MKIENSRMVSITYELREKDSTGKVIEVVKDDRPLSFIFGMGSLLPAFESNLSPLSKGDSFSFGLEAADAYGERIEQMIIDVPVSVFQRDGVIDENICQVGNTVPMTDGSGNPLNGTILEITDQSVRMDFNHPMAGVNLFFSGNVIDVREATDEGIRRSSHSCSSCVSEGESGCSGSCS